MLVTALVGGLAMWLLTAPARSDRLPGEGPAAPVFGAANDTTTPFNLVSLPALIEHAYDGSGLTLTRTLHREASFVRYAIAYRGNGLRLTGTLALPTAAAALGARPVVVADHGYLDPRRYLRGAGLLREETALARAGFVVLHPDYRNFGGSQVESGKAVKEPLGYPADVINAVLALKQAHLSRVDTTRIGLLGRSMGGGVSLQAAIARPDLFTALELYSPVSSEATDNYRRFAEGDAALRQRVLTAYGDPDDAPTFWAQASSRNYLSRLRGMPVQINHGTSDVICPIAWSRATAHALAAAGVPTQLIPYAGEPHRFDRQWPRFRDTMLAFWRAQLG